MSINDLSDETLEQIISYVDSKTRAVLCSVSQNINKIAMKVYTKIYYQSLKPYKNHYAHDILAQGDYQFFAIRCDRRDIIKNPDYCLRGACKGGNLDLVWLVLDVLMKSDIDCYYFYGLIGAYMGGHQVCIQLMTDLSTQHGQVINYELAFIATCAGGHIDIVKTLISQDVTNYMDGIIEVCRNVNPSSVDIMHLLIPLCALGDRQAEAVVRAKQNRNFACLKVLADHKWPGVCLEVASWCDDPEMFQKLEGLGYYNYDGAFEIACEHESMNVVEMMLKEKLDQIDPTDGFLWNGDEFRKKYAKIIMDNNISVDVEVWLRHAVNQSDQYMIDFLYENYSKKLYNIDVKPNINTLMERACAFGHMDEINQLALDGADIIAGYITAWKNNQLDVAKFLYKLGVNPSHLHKDLCYACRANNHNMIRWLISIGSNYCEHCNENAYDHVRSTRPRI
jgi:hypothetical protein